MKDLIDTLAIDANVIIRFLLRDHAELSPKAKAIIDAVQAKRLRVLCDPVTLAEVAWVLKSFYKLTPEQIVKELRPLVEAECFRVPNKGLYLRALDLFSSTVPHFGDACACAAALEECEGKLLSFDKKLSRADGIERLENL